MANWWETGKALGGQLFNLNKDLLQDNFLADLFRNDRVQHEVRGFSANQPQYKPPPPRIQTSSTSSSRNQTGRNLRPKGNPPRAQENPLGGLYEQLLEMLTASASVDRGAIRGQIDPVYDARIEALESLMGRAEERTSEGRQNVEQMYEALGQDYERLAPEAAAQAEDMRKQIEDLYGDLRTTVEGNFAEISKEQGDLFKQLGIEEAAPEALAGQQEMTLSAMNRADELGAINQQRQMDVGNIDQNYYRQGAPLARLTGSNRSADMASTLQDYLAQASGQIDMVNAERTAAFNQLLSQAQQGAQSQERDQMKMLFDLMTSQMSGEQEPVTSSSYLASLPGNLQQDVASTFRQLEKSPESVYGYVNDPRSANPDTFRSTTDAWWYNKVDELAEAGQISEPTRQALINFLRLRFNE